MARQPLTLAEKNEVRRFHAAQSGAPTQSEMMDWVHAKFAKSIGRSSIARILSSAVDVGEVTMGPKRFRKRSSKYPDIEAALLTFILANRDTVVFTDDVLWDQARVAAAGRQVSMSWVQRFKNRNNLRAKSRALLTSSAGSGAEDEGEGASSQAAFIAALAMRRDELLAMADKDVAAADDAEATEEDVESGSEIVVPSQQQEEQLAQEQELEKQPQVPQQQIQEQPVQQQQRKETSVAVPAVPSLVTPTRKATPPPKSSPSATSPRFTIVSQSTGRVELENRSHQQRVRNSKPPMPKSVAASPSPATKTAATPVASPFRTPPTKRARVEDQAPDYEYGDGDGDDPDDAAEQRSDRGTSSKSSEYGTPSTNSEQGTPSKRLEEREAELRVEGLRTDNMLKRIKVAEENMLARKRLKDAGIAQDEIDALLPIVRIQDA